MPHSQDSTQATECAESVRGPHPDWSALAKTLGLNATQTDQFVQDADRLWSLPFAEIDCVLDLLLFRAGRLPKLAANFPDAGFSRLATLFELLVSMALQGNSLFPSTVVDLAVKAKLSLETYPYFLYRLEPLIDLLIDRETGRPKPGNNRFIVADLQTVLKCERERRQGAIEHIYKEGHKFESYREQVRVSDQFKADWETLKTHFDTARYQDSRKIIRRSKLPERNWQRPSSSDLDLVDQRFRAVFDFFCWKWFLYGMRGDEPLIEKFTFTLTPLGTQIFIPGYWSFDGARDIDWKQIAKAHKARGVQRQGEKITSNMRAKRHQLASVLAADREAKSKAIRGEKRYSFIKRQAGLTQETDNAQVRRFLREANQFCKGS